MSSIINNKPTLSLKQLNENLIMLNQSLKGIAPVITTQQVNDILQLSIASNTLTWNWSKSFNYQYK